MCKMPYAQSALSRTLQGGGGLRLLGSQGSLTQLIKTRGWFMTQVLSLFVAQLVVTYIVFQTLGGLQAFQAWIDSHKVVFIILSVVSPLLIICVLAFVPMPMYIKLVLFTLFSTLIGASFSMLKRIVPDNVIRVSILGAIVVFASMFFLGLTLMLLGVNLWWLGIILFVALLGLIITSIVFLFIEPSNQAIRIKAGIAIALFAIFVIFDTNQILQRDYAGDFVTAAIDYYLDTINLFINLVQYAMSD